ncbi:GIY-YIG nuclease family protein [Vibrio sp. TBV020]|uniref:GIY-YIG nuclease family protein n=1 Tax=Vibrio sp. TBV020 TaxID=3137398 RepID=UPI0038CDBEA9
MSSTNTKTHSDWYVYLVRMRNNALYCGITTDVERRFLQHCNGTGAKALKGKGPFKLVWSQLVGDSRSGASKVEYRIKRLTKPQKESLVSGIEELSNLVEVELID